MISWIVATHDTSMLERNLLPTLPLRDSDEFILIKDAESIGKAYAEGQERATQPVKCYIHHDVQIFHLDDLRAALIPATLNHGLVGVIGSLDACLPWWNGRRLGSVFDSRLGRLDYGDGGQCAIVDGLLLATRQTIEWDLAMPGWHLYDHDACAQMHAAGRTVYCLWFGADLVGHFSDSAFDLGSIDGWPEAERYFREKWQL